MELSAINLHDADAIERGVAAFARYPNGGLVVTSSPFGTIHPDAVAALVSRYKLPADYPFRYCVSAGGLASYGPDNVSQFRPAAEYVDRILSRVKSPPCGRGLPAASGVGRLTLPSAWITWLASRERCLHR